MNYWLDLFTGTTWRQFRDAGASISGFRERKRRAAATIQPGDILLCYLTGVMRWVGALRVLGPSEDESKIWDGGDFPVRFQVETIVALQPESGIPMAQLESKVAFYAGPQDRGRYRGFVRGSPNRFTKQSDGELILRLLQEAELNPVMRPVDAKKLARKPLFKAKRRVGKRTIETLVTVPEVEDSGVLPSEQHAADMEGATGGANHNEIQYMLLELGVDMGLDVWVARNDRGRIWQGKVFGSLPRMVSDLPTQFNDATQRTIELIDVLWLRGNSIVAAFEVESTTSIYSGLLRMSDLLALQPNLDIRLYLVAPDERRDKVEQEIRRPTFELLPKPLSKVCGFLPFSKLQEKVKGIRDLGLAQSLTPDFLERTAHYFQSGNGAGTR